jgi:hypothetical protein
MATGRSPISYAALRLSVRRFVESFSGRRAQLDLLLDRSTPPREPAAWRLTLQTPADDSVTLVEILDVPGSFDEARQLIQAGVARLEREGVPGLASMNFYEDAAAKELAAVITFSNSSEILAHTRMISGWPEFQRFATLIRVKDMRIHGRVSAEVRAWLDQFQGPRRLFETHLAGFSR